MEEEKPKRKSREMLQNRRMGNPENKLLGKATVAPLQLSTFQTMHIYRSPQDYDFFN